MRSVETLEKIKERHDGNGRGKVVASSTDNIEKYCHVVQKDPATINPVLENLVQGERVTTFLLQRIFYQGIDQRWRCHSLPPSKPGMRVES